MAICQDRAKVPANDHENIISIRINIIKIKAKQRLTRIMVANITPKRINNAFNKLIKKLTIITDLFTLYQKPGIGKGCL
jgi:hypothetical protein